MFVNNKEAPVSQGLSCGFCYQPAYFFLRLAGLRPVKSNNPPQRPAESIKKEVQKPNSSIVIFPVQFGHVGKVHPIDACNKSKRNKNWESPRSMICENSFVGKMDF